MPTDEDLLARWSEGDRLAGNDLFRRHYDRLRRFFEGKAHDDADELIQSTFFALVRYREQLAGASSFRAYLFTVAKNELYRTLRRRYKNADVDFAVTSLCDLQTTAGSKMVRAREKQVLLEALRSLPLDQQVLIELHYWEGITTDGLAPMFGVAPATIRTRLFRARKRLRTQMDAFEGRITEGLDEAALERWARDLPGAQSASASM